MPHTHANEGIVIILNGPSSVGKTSIQKALQKLSQKTFLRVGIDTFFDGLIEEPDLSAFQQEKKFEQYTSEGEFIRGVVLSTDGDGHPLVTLNVGSAGNRIIFGMHRAIAAYAQTGNNLIVDYILYDSSWLPDLAQALSGFKTYLIKVHAPLEVIESREKIRNTSPVGHARSHYNTVHNNMVYDLSLDTSVCSPEECAAQILQLLHP